MTNEPDDGGQKLRRERSRIRLGLCEDSGLELAVDGRGSLNGLKDIIDMVIAREGYTIRQCRHQGLLRKATAEEVKGNVQMIHKAWSM